MAETAQTMTEFTYAPGEKNIVGDRFSPSVIIFWLKTSIAASSTRVQYKAPNTLFGLIPLGASTKTIPLRNIASVDTNTKFNLGSLVWGLFFLFVGFGMFDSNALAAIVCLLVAVANFANVMSATLTFHDPSGGANAITVSILEKDRLMSLAQEIQTRVFTDADQLRHEESMHMAEKQYTAQTNSVLIQQQMLASQQAPHGRKTSNRKNGTWVGKDASRPICISDNENRQSRQRRRAHSDIAANTTKTATPALLYSLGYNNGHENPSDRTAPQVRKA